VDGILSVQGTKPAVFLVGAGPGDPGLLTVRGANLLERADVVVYDALVNPSLLSRAAHAEKIYVGKKSAAHSMPQEAINQLLIDKAREGKRVVRLKGGDPFVFGRGGEEAEALVAAGIQFEVVPGITAAIAAPAYAGIPVTHRDFNSSFTLVTGHERDDEESNLDWATLAKLPCLAFYMGTKSLPRICAKLIENGMNPATSAATIAQGTTPQQKTVASTLGGLASAVAAAKLPTPALTIIGHVVQLRETLNWFERRPLFGQTIVVTRTRQQASELSEKLAELGANVLEAPTIELFPPSDWKPVDDSLRRLGEYDWIIFTSANGVRFVKQRLAHLRLDARSFGHAKIAAVGNATASAVRDELFLTVNLIPESFIAEALADEFAARNEIAGKKFLLLRADIARPLVRERLIAGGAASADDVAVYETRTAKSLPAEVLDALAEKNVNWITFTSSSTADNFAQLLGPNYAAKLEGVKSASIGPITTAKLQQLGLAPTVQAANFDIEGLVAAIATAGNVS
jgi:uroporphyrinogen III methyltransferase / synthase